MVSLILPKIGFPHLKFETPVPLHQYLVIFIDFRTLSLLNWVLSNHHCLCFAFPWLVCLCSVVSLYLMDTAHCFFWYWTLSLPDGVHSNRPCPSVSPSVFRYLWDCSLVFSNFGPRVYPMGFIVITLVSPLVCLSVHPSVFEYLGDHTLFFFNFLHEVREP